MSHQLLCCGDATDLATWSNIPFFLLQAGQSRGVLSSGLVLRPERLPGTGGCGTCSNGCAPDAQAAFSTATGFYAACGARRVYCLHQRPALPLAESLPIAAAIPLAPETGRSASTSMPPLARCLTTMALDLELLLPSRKQY